MTAEKAPAGCSCSVCQEACRNKPGWFKPGEAEKVAEFLGITLPELFARYLMADVWKGVYGRVAVLSPGIKGGPAGRVPKRSSGECVFFEGGLCSIHPVKPHECRISPHPGGVRVHEEIRLAWLLNQHQIVSLLGGSGS